MALLSEYFVKNLAKEVKKGQKERVQKGSLPGKVPYGYFNENKKIFVDEEKAAIIRKIFEMYALDGNGYGIIVKYLNDNRIPTRENNLWKHYHIQRILRNRFYMGEIEYGNEIYPSSAPTIITKELFELAERQQNKRGEPSQYRTDRKSTVLFAGLLFCGECKHAMGTIANQGKYRYYLCQYAKQTKICTQHHYIMCHRLEEALLSDIEIMAKQKKVIIEVPIVEQPVYISEMRREKIKEELERAKAAYVRAVFSLDEYVDMKEKLEQELKFLDKEKTKKPEKVNIKSNIKTMLKELKACDDNDITRMKAVLHKYISHIYYTPSNVYIKWVRS